MKGLGGKAYGIGECLSYNGSFSCDANLVNFFEIEMFSASLSLAAKDTPRTGKNIRVYLLSRGGVEMKKRMACVSHPLKDSIVNNTIW